MPGRILIVDDGMTSRIDLAARLAPAAYEVVMCSDPAEALRAARAQLPDVVLVAARLPNGGAYGLCPAIRALPGGRQVPVAILGEESDRARRLAGLEAGFDAVLCPVPRPQVLRARVRNLLRRGSLERDLMRDDGASFGFAEKATTFSRPGQITLIAPGVETGLDWRNLLLPLVRDRIDVLSPERALAELGAGGQPDAIVIAARADQHGSALRLLSDLRCRGDTHRAAIILVQQQPDPDFSVMALDLGVDDLVETGFDPVEMALRLRRELARKSRSDRCRSALQDGLRLAATDALTGLYNRRYAMAELQRVLTDPGECVPGFAVMLLDLDRFKRINDTLGHAAGDTVLREVSARMAACLREGDFLARIGGEEFLAVVRDCTPEAAARTAERLRKSVCDRPVRVGAEASVDVTLSIGLVMAATGTATGPDALVDLADQALYAAKTDGRNQVSLHEAAA